MIVPVRDQRSGVLVDRRRHPRAGEGGATLALAESTQRDKSTELLDHRL